MPIPAQFRYKSAIDSHHVCFVMDRSISREWFLRTALAYLGTPYVWGGDDPSGFDCSGFVIECLKSAGLLSESDDYTADGLLKLFGSHSLDKPEKSALLFLLNEKGKAVHVTICLDEHFQIGASGGCATTTNSAAAWQANAYVKIRPIRFNAANMRVVRLFRHAVKISAGAAEGTIP